MSEWEDELLICHYSLASDGVVVLEQEEKDPYQARRSFCRSWCEIWFYLARSSTYYAQRIFAHICIYMMSKTSCLLLCKLCILCRSELLSVYCHFMGVWEHVDSTNRLVGNL